MERNLKIEGYGFTCFDVLNEDRSVVPDLPGDYIVVLREGACLPEISVQPVLSSWEGLNVIYVGQSKKSLRQRDVRQHFNGNAGSSTLRKSLGCLKGLTLVPRDADKPDNGKTKFGDDDEQELSEWMKANLLFYYCVNSKVDHLEKMLIQRFNPPLNLKGNKNPVNADYRKELSSLRKKKNKLY